MKRILTLSLSLLTFTFVHAATVNWGTVESSAAIGDTSPSLAQTVHYSAYFLTKAMAEAIFSAADVGAVSTSLQENYSEAKEQVEANGTALTSADYGLGQYSFTMYSGTSLAGKDYLAILFYESGDDYEFRVFGALSAMMSGSNLVFDDQTATADTVGSWTQVAVVPEPATGALFLLGLTALCRRRRRA